MARGAYHRFWRQRRHDFFYLLALYVRFLGQRLPRNAGLTVFGMFGLVTWHLARRDRTRTINHLRLVFGESWDESRIRRTARAVFINIGKNLFDAIRLPRLSTAEADRIVHCDRLDALHRAHQAGRGPIVITAHLGCFEMLLPYFTRRGIKGFAVGQRLFDSRIDAMVASARGGDMEYVARDANPREVVRRLLSGHSFGVLIDQDTNVDGVFAHFLGHLAYTPCGPVRLAMRMNIPLFVVTATRSADNTHRVKITGPLTLASGDTFDNDLVRNVEMVNRVMSEAISRAPEQWVWMHRRWHRKPTDRGMSNVPSIEHIRESPPA